MPTAEKARSGESSRVVPHGLMLTTSLELISSAIQTGCAKVLCSKIQ